VIVVDASAVGALLLEDHGAAYADRLRDAFVADDLSAPVHWPVETMTLIFKAQRQGRFAVSRLAEFWSRAEDVIALAQIEDVRVDRRLLDLVEDTGLTPRDAAYLDVARRYRAAVASADRALIKASLASGLDVIGPD
jgi:predicted nucleic acid-binding protein